MTFAQPLWFWAFALLPLLVIVFFQNENRRRVLLGKLIATRLHDRLAGTVSVVKRRWRFALILLGLAALIVSLAQPRFGFTWQESKRRGRDVIIAIDTSKSMLATDLAPNRLTRAKLAAQDLINELHGDRVGVIAFAGGAFLQAPLTADSNAVLGSLQELDTEIIPRGGTDIAGAIRTALDAFGKGESDHRALIVFTDGEELDADGIKEAEKQKDVLKIFTIGLGSADGSLIPMPGARGGTEFLKDNDGQIVKSKLDEDRLRKIAEAAGGFYLRLQSSREQMGQLVRDGLGKMTETDIDAKVSRQPIERYQWPLGAAILLFASSMLIGERRRAAAVALLFVMSSAAFGKNSGVEAYEKNDFAGAAERFSKQLRLRPGSPELNFNLGSAAYQAGDLDKALEAFSKALTSPDPALNAKAEYNLGNTLFKRGAELKEKEPKVQEWKNALQHYDQALKGNPKNSDAQYNRDLVAKLIEEQEKQQQEEQKKDDQKKDDKKQDKKDKQDKDKKDSKDGDKKDQEKQEDGDKKDDQKQDGKDGEKKDSQEKSGKGEDKKDAGKKDGQKGDAKDEKGEDSEQSKPEEPGKKKEGELKEAPQFDKDSKEAKDAAEQAESEAAALEGRMTERQAKSLLDSLKAEDARVHLLDPHEQKRPNRVIRDW